jgi:hypothetical protein
MWLALAPNSIPDLRGGVPTIPPPFASAFHHGNPN